MVWLEQVPRAAFIFAPGVVGGYASGMRYLLTENLAVSLASNDRRVRHYWRRMFDGWGWPEPAETTRQISLAVDVVDQLPPVPTERPFFTAQMSESDIDWLHVYKRPEGLTLRFTDGAAIVLHFGEDSLSAQGQMNESFLYGSGYLEDLLITSLSPFLRREGIFLMHAFAAAYDGQGLLLVGTSGSGKTTTGLCLLQAGWHYLANDTIAFRLDESGGIQLLALPGIFGIRPETYELLPALRRMIGRDEAFVPPTSSQIPPERLMPAGRWLSHAPLSRICFPTLPAASTAVSHLRPINKAIALALLMEQSVDRWDEVYFDEQMRLLEIMVSQAKIDQLDLGRDMNQLAGLLSN